MNAPRLGRESRASLWLAAAALLVFAAACGLLGWYVGGRPPGWVEGKSLWDPLLTGTRLALILALVSLLLACLGVWLAGLSRPRSVRDWGVVAFAGGVVGALLLNLTTAWGFAIIYFISSARQAVWMH